jgi:hypothetical protein
MGRLRPVPQQSITSGGPAFIPVSAVFQRLHDEAPAEHFTLGWLMQRLQKRSFGIIMLLLGVAAMAPGVSFVVGILLMIPAFEMILNRSTPAFPRRITTRQLPTRHLAAMVQRSVPVLRYLEKVIHPRWHIAHHAIGRIVGIAIAMLSATLIFIPIPLSNVVPALVIAFIALAWIEEDGLFLAVSLLAAMLLLAVAGVGIWETVVGAAWITRSW